MMEIILHRPDREMGVTCTKKFPVRAVHFVHIEVYGLVGNTN